VDNIWFKMFSRGTKGITTLKHTHSHFMALLDFVRDYPSEPVPER